MTLEGPPGIRVTIRDIDERRNRPPAGRSGQDEALEALGARTSASGPGARSGRTTAPTARPGTTSPTTTPDRAPIAGTRTGWPASPTGTSGSALRVALWNGQDPILKERLFGLTGSEGNHGEDVKEYYFYLDSTPTHSLHAVPLQVSAAGIPLCRSGGREPAPRPRRARSTSWPTPACSTSSRYFDVFVEYAKASTEDILITIRVHNRGPEDAPAPPAADSLVPQHLVVGRSDDAAPAAPAWRRRLPAA